MPDTLRERMLRAAKFNKGYDMSEQLAAALLDMHWHSLSSADIPRDVDSFEALALRQEQMDLAAVPPRYRRATVAATSRISSAAAMPQVITPTCGRRCWPMTAISGLWSRVV